MESMHLQGAESVRTAGRQIDSAADTMMRAAMLNEQTAQRIIESNENLMQAMNRLADAMEKSRG